MTTPELRAKAEAIKPLLEKASDIARRAADQNRAMTADERRTYDSAMSQAEPVLAALKANRHTNNFGASMSEISALGRPGGKSGQRLSFRGMAGGISNRMLSGDMGQKALAPSGATVVAQGFTEDPIALGRAATGLLDILPVQVQPTAEYAFLRQTARTNNAAVVADGDPKPESVLGLTRVEQSLAIVAHISKGVPRYWVADNAALEQFVASELEYGLARAVEAKVIADINGTSGIQVQAFSTSILQTLRKSITKLEVAGHQAAAAVLHPADWEAVELALTSATAVERQGIPFDAATRRLFGVVIASTTSQTPGTAHVLGAGAVVLDSDAQGVQVMWSETSNADDFAKNLIRARVEGRYGTSVLSPLGVVVATLEDDES